MDTMLRNALRKHSALRQQLDNVLLGDDGDMWETELKKFLAKRVCWNPNLLHPVDFDPAIFIGNGWKWAGKDADTRSLELTEINFSKVLFEACLEEGEERITGEEKRHRLIALRGIHLDPRFGVTLLKEEGQKTLERLYQEQGITYIDFFGRFLVHPSGRRCVLYLGRNGDGRWRWDVRWLVSDWDDRSFSACLAS